MTQEKPHKTELILFLAALFIAGIGLYYLSPSITGFVVKEFSYTNNLNLVVTSSGNYTWQLSSIGDLKSVRIDGRVTNSGKARVYIESNDIKYLVFDSARIGKSNETANESENLITGFAVKDKDNDSEKDDESDKDRKKKNKKPDWTSGVDEFVINRTASINLSQHFTDEDNDTLAYSAGLAENITITISEGAATLIPADGFAGTSTTAFTAFDGKNLTIKFVTLIIPEKIANITEPINITLTANHAPKWVSDADLFILNKTLTIDLLQYFADEDNETLTFNVSDAADIAESINGSILTLTAALDNFNATITLTASDGNLSISKDIKLVIPLTITAINETITKTIAISLNYKSGTIYDANDNGEESVNGVVDLTVESTKFNWYIDRSRLCTRWEVYNVEEEALTAFCNGNNGCCAFVGLLPTKADWDDIYYSTFGKDGAGYGNIVSAQVLYYDVNLSVDNPKSEIYYSGWDNLSVEFFDEETGFFGECVETCSLSGLNKSSYTLIFEIENDAVLRIDKIKYSILADVENSAPLLLQNFSAINVEKNKNLTINLSQYFTDPDGDVLSYDYYKADNIMMLFSNNTATIAPDKDFEGTTPTYITANDSEKTAVSNLFMINVSAESINHFFEIRDKEGSKLAAFDSFGNLRIKGNLSQNAELKADFNDFAIQNSSESLSLVVTNPEGNMLIKGSLSENLPILNATENSFVIQDKDEEVVAYLNSTGSLFLKGKLNENVKFDDSAVN
ncbi:hypothetical protein HYY71_03505 [Candidatus Woesearchaeota archaeon]|nr:hypothetical protein [Candidatus Woesearchaeota archaeon]